MASPQPESTVASAPTAVVLPFPGVGQVARSSMPPLSGRAARSRRAPRPAPGAQPPLRLTRRGRRVVAGLSIAFGLSVAAATVAVEVAGAEGGLELAGSTTVVVQPGDTLWSIAGDIAPEEDRRAVVDALLDVNGLAGVGLVPGQVLELP